MKNYKLMIYSGTFKKRINEGVERMYYAGDYLHEIYTIEIMIDGTGNVYQLDISLDAQTVRFYVVESCGREVDAEIEFTDHDTDGSVSSELLYRVSAQCVNKQPIRFNE